MVLLKLYILKNKSKNYENKTVIGSYDWVMKTRFTLWH